MIREIKFRAWDVTLKEINYSGDEKGSHKLSNFWSYIDDRPEEYIVEQYTGLKDMEGKEIFEGDIVQFYYWWFDGNERDSILTGAIVYDNKSMSFQLKGVKNKDWESFTGYENDTEYLTPFSELNFQEADFEIIGNIHENPELLNE